MTDLKLYTLVVPNDPQVGLEARLQQQLATSGALGQDTGIVEALSSEPGDQTISGYYRDQYAGKMATELEELARASGVRDLPVTGLDGSTSVDGYYSLETADVEQVQPHTDRVQYFNLSLTQKGTRSDYYRALKVNRLQVDHAWGPTHTATVGIPATASKVQWFNEETETRSTATPIETRTAQLGDVDIYDLDDGEAAVGTTNPTLLYEIGYGAEELCDCRVWDTRSKGPKFDTDGNLQWAKTFVTDHDIDHPIVLDNGILQVWLDEGSGDVYATEWDPNAISETNGGGLYGSGLYGSGIYPGTHGGWVGVGLDQPDTVDVFDIDIRTVGMVRDQARITFDVDGDLYTVDFTLSTGMDEVLISIVDPERQGPMPSVLSDWLAPIASTSIVDPQPAKTLVDRRGVN